MIENQNIEWKESWRDEYLKWICGFANSQGGKIFIGINDKGEVVGNNNIVQLLEEIPNKSKNILGVIVDVNHHKNDEGNFLEIVVESYPNPVNYKGRYFYRSGSTIQEFKGSALDSFLLKKNGKKWDGVSVPNVSVSELDDSTIAFFKKKAVKNGRLDSSILEDDKEILLENLKLKGNKYLNRAAILLFHPTPEKFIQGAYIKIGYFESHSELIYQDEIHGNLFNQIEKTIDLIFTKYTKAIISYEGINRIETFEYPKEAVREALLNAISHKDYSRGYPIQISVYNDRLMIWNSGELPENWDVSNLLTKHSSKPFNPDIANAFFRSGYIESWGRGTIKILEKCKETGLPEPFFSYEPFDFWIEFRKDIYNEKYLKSIGVNNRQILAVIFAKKHKKITNKDYQRINDCSRNTASSDLVNLVKRNIFIDSGQKGAGAFYKLK